MKKTVLKEVDCCDVCGKDDYVTACMGCGVDHCYDCSKTEGKTYPHAVHFSGSGDGYYCKTCDYELTVSGGNQPHAAYRKIESLRNEEKAWCADFRKRSDSAEEKLSAIRALEKKS